jgi:hypothetical protein
MGTEKISRKIRDRFFWPGMNTDIQNIIKSCLECQMTKKQTRPLVEELNPIPKRKQPFFQVHLDIMGPLQKSASRNEYVLIIIDGFTKFAIVEPMKNQKAWTVAQIFVDRCITKFGCPSIVSSDQGRQFVGQVFAELSEIIGFEHNC